MSGTEKPLTEATIIAEFFAPLTEADPGAAGLTDDCAVIAPPPGMDLVVTTDSLIEGVHFFAGDIPAFKALAVNVSDLIAKGATPHAYLLNVALPAPPTRALLASLSAGLAEAQRRFGCRLIGGDTDSTPGRFTLTITAIGIIKAGYAVRRSAARPGDLLAVTGTIGDAGLGLRLRRDAGTERELKLAAADAAYLIERFERPVPPVAAARLVRDFARASMDVSDGLARDLARMAAASGTGAELRLDQVPLSEPARTACAKAGLETRDLIASGEDYELLMAVPPDNWDRLQREAHASGVAVRQIGVMTQTPEIVWRDVNSKKIELTAEGWDHFAAGKV